METITYRDVLYLIDFEMKYVFYKNIRNPIYAFTIYNENHILLCNPDRTRELQSVNMKKIILEAYGKWIYKKLLE